MSTQAGFAAALLDPQAAAPACLRAWNGSDVARRFDVHRNNVMISLTSALADTVPVVRSLVGAEFFAAMAGVFVREQPPRSPVLATFGSGLPEFIESFEPARTVPYLADVARLEMARVEAFHAADAPGVSAAAIEHALASGPRMAEALLLPHPSLRLVISDHPIVSIWAAHHENGDLESIDLGRSEAALVLRPELDVVVILLPTPAIPFVASLLRARPLGESASLAAADDCGFSLAESLGLLLRHGALAAIHVPPGVP
jgi:hypothetical protein